MNHPDKFPPLPAYVINGLLIGWNSDGDRTAVGLVANGYNKDEAVLLRFDIASDKWLQCRQAHASEISRYDMLWLEELHVHSIDCICEYCRQMRR